MAATGRGNWVQEQKDREAREEAAKDHEKIREAAIADQQIPLSSLNSDLTIGDMKLTSRAVMAPLTRCRAIEGSDHVPGDLMVEYYKQRATKGSLIIAEATMIDPGQSAFWTEPGIYSDDQVVGWKKVVDAVHAKGGFIFLQIWHGGRACHPLNSTSKENPEGNQPIAPSPVRIVGGQSRSVFNPTGEAQDYVTPRELTVEEIRDTLVVPAFVRAAKNAVHGAGFDGVEIHAANGYLVDQFLRSSANQRPEKKEDPFNGSSLETRSNLLMAIIDRIKTDAGLPDSKIGVRLSPLNSFQDMKDEDPVKWTEYVCDRLTSNGGPLAFIHLMRSDFFLKQTGEVIAAARKGMDSGASDAVMPTPLMVNMGYTPREGDSTIAAREADLICFGKLFINNPDLVDRLRRFGYVEKQRHKSGEGEILPLLNERKANVDLFYTHGPEGYIDYPTLEEQWKGAGASSNSTSKI